jgi:hypothetical protein
MPLETTASGRAPSSGGSKTAAVLAPLASELERYDTRHLMPMVVRSGSLLHREGEASSYPGGRGPCARESQSGGVLLGRTFQWTAERLKTLMAMVVSAAAKTVTTARLRVAIRVVLCMFQMLWSPVLSPSSP